MFGFEQERTKSIRIELRNNYFPQDWIEDISGVLEFSSDVAQLSNEDLEKLRVACGYSHLLAQLLGVANFH